MGNKKINMKNQITSLFVITLIFCCITISFAKLRKDDDHSHPATHVANKIRTHINEHHPEMNRSEIRAHFEEMEPTNMDPEMEPTTKNTMMNPKTTMKKNTTMNQKKTTTMKLQEIELLPLSFKMVPNMLQIKSEHILMNTTLK